MSQFTRNAQSASQYEIHLLETLGVLADEKPVGERQSLRCPIPGHDDVSPSAVYFPRTRRFHCSVCTPGRAITLEELRRILGHHAPPPARHPSTEHSPTPGTPACFPPTDAQRAWSAALARARDDAHAGDPDTRDVMDYLARRGIATAWEESLFGIVASDMDLPEAMRTWPGRGYKLVAPLLDAQTGDLVSIQARTIRAEQKPKTLFPRGSRAQGTAFATAAALAILCRRGDSFPRSSPPRAVILGEGLTDFLALGIHAAVPVLAAPGAGAAIGALGPWARGRVVCLAVDCDPAGEAVVEEASRAAFRAGARAVRRIVWPAGAKDACDALAALGTERFQIFLDTFVGETR